MYEQRALYVVLSDSVSYRFTYCVTLILRAQFPDLMNEWINRTS